LLREPTSPSVRHRLSVALKNLHHIGAFWWPAPAVSRISALFRPVNAPLAESRWRQVTAQGRRDRIALITGRPPFQVPRWRRPSFGACDGPSRQMSGSWGYAKAESPDRHIRFAARPVPGEKNAIANRLAARSAGKRLAQRPEILPRTATPASARLLLRNACFQHDFVSRCVLSARLCFKVRAFSTTLFQCACFQHDGGRLPQGLSWRCSGSVGCAVAGAKSRSEQTLDLFDFARRLSPVTSPVFQHARLPPGRRGGAGKVWNS